jgi:hypothetical protein
MKNNAVGGATLEGPEDLRLAVVGGPSYFQNLSTIWSETSFARVRLVARQRN